MCNVKWAGTPTEYTRSRSSSKRSDRWMSPTPRTEWCFMLWFSVASIVLSCVALIGCVATCFM